MSTVETNLVQPSTGTTLTLGASGDTISIPSGATITNSGTATGFSSGDNTPAFQAYLSANMTATDGAWTKITCNTEDYDTDSAYDNSTNYRFTVPSGEGGKYYLYFYSGMQASTGNTGLSYGFNIRVNSETDSNASFWNMTAVGYAYYKEFGGIAGVRTLAAGDTVEFYMWADVSSGYAWYPLGDSTQRRTYVGGYKMIGL